MTATRLPEPADFTLQWDETHSFDFFEDEHADYLWAFSTIEPAEFARQVNEYDIISGWIEPGEVRPYTADDVEYRNAIVVSDNDDPYSDRAQIRVVGEDTTSSLVAVISR